MKYLRKTKMMEQLQANLVAANLRGDFTLVIISVINKSLNQKESTTNKEMQNYYNKVKKQEGGPGEPSQLDEGISKNISKGC